MTLDRPTLAAFAIAACLVAGAPARAQTAASDSAAILAVTQRVFDAMAVGDSTALHAVIYPGAQVISIGSGGNVRVRSATDWIRTIGLSGGVGRERIWAPRVEIDGDLATLWARFDFYVGGRLDRCGTDAFQFARDPQSGWRLLAVTFSVETEGCETGDPP